MQLRAYSRTLVTASLITLRASGQDAPPPPASSSPDGVTSETNTTNPPPPADPSVDGPPATATPADAQTPAASVTSAQTAPATAPALAAPASNNLVIQPNQESPYIAQAERAPSPRRAAFFGIGFGGGRMQDKVTGLNGASFALEGGFSVNPTLGFVLGLAGLLGSSNDKGTLSNFGLGVSGQLHLFDFLRISLGPGYYWLSHDPPKDENGKSERNSVAGPGVQGGIGLEPLRFDSGLTIGVDVRSQASFLEGELLTSTYGLLAARFYGVGGKKTTAKARPAPQLASLTSKHDNAPEN